MKEKLYSAKILFDYQTGQTEDVFFTRATNRIHAKKHFKRRFNAI